MIPLQYKNTIRKEDVCVFILPKIPHPITIAKAANMKIPIRQHPT